MTPSTPESFIVLCLPVRRTQLDAATHSRTQHAFDSIHTTHLLFSSAYTSNVHVSSISDKAVGVCVCAGGKISRLHTHLSILLV